VWAAATLLFGFHLALFAERWATGELLDPLAAGRWLAGAGLLAGLALLRRSGVSIWWGRRAAVLWVLVFFLHGSVGNPAVAGAETAEAGVETTFILVVLPTAGAAAAVLGIGLLVLLAFHRRCLVAPPVARLAAGPVSPSAGTPDAHSPALWARPPPRR
jgi:hypothetical protein